MKIGPRRGLKVRLQAAPAFDSLGWLAKCSPVRSPALNVLVLGAACVRAAALQGGSKVECDLDGGNPIACARHCAGEGSEAGAGHTAGLNKRRQQCRTCLW
jgi:hypothetical protein